MWRASRSGNPPMRLPDGPRTPRLVRAVRFIVSPLEYLDSCAERYGDPLVMKGGKSGPSVYFSDPKAIETIFTADPDLFEERKGDRVLRYLLGEDSVILLSGDRHRRHRRLLQPPLHGERLLAYGKDIREIADRVMNRWTPHEPFHVRSSMQEMTLTVIVRAVLGHDDGPHLQQLRRRLGSLIDTMGSRWSTTLALFSSPQRAWGPLSPWGRFVRKKRQLDQLLYDELRQRREANDPSRGGVLDLLMSARDAAGRPMSESELRDNLMALLFAGHETTASALTWALYWIHHLPEVHDMLRDEIAGLGDRADPSEISRLPYLTAVCQETLRIYPIVLAVARTLKSPLEVMGHRFEAGTALIPCIYLTHRREDLYPNPERFEPDRFLEKQFSPYEYLPFGGGDRRCLGMAFAFFEMKLILATILSRWEMALTDRRPMKPVRRSVFMAPPGSMRMVVTGRNHRLGTMRHDGG